MESIAFRESFDKVKPQIDKLLKENLSFWDMTADQIRDYEGSIYGCTAHFPSIVHKGKTVPSDFESPSLLNLNMKICKAIAGGANISHRYYGVRYKEDDKFVKKITKVETFDGVK